MKLLHPFFLQIFFIGNHYDDDIDEDLPVQLSLTIHEIISLMRYISSFIIVLCIDCQMTVPNQLLLMGDSIGVIDGKL